MTNKDMMREAFEKHVVGTLKPIMGDIPRNPNTELARNADGSYYHHWIRDRCLDWQAAWELRDRMLDDEGLVKKVAESILGMGMKVPEDIWERATDEIKDFYYERGRCALATIKQHLKGE